MTDHTANAVDGTAITAAAEGEVAVPRKRVPAVAPLPGNDFFCCLVYFCGCFGSHLLLTV